ncbi:hypothetical protein [Streptomyces sp. NPDC001020]
MSITPLRQQPSWKALEQHHSEMGTIHLRELFAQDPGRGERMCAEASGLYLDYSKNRVTDETVRLLCDFARECGLEERREIILDRGVRRHTDAVICRLRYRVDASR